MSENNNDDFVRKTAGERLYTYGDYLNWTGEQRYELINGRVYLMSPAPSRRHQKIIVELIRQFSTYLLDKKGGRGAPDLVIEIISPSTEKRDKEIKKDLYERHGVQEYWLVNDNQKIVEVYLLEEKSKGKYVYEEPAVYTEKDKISVNILSALEINLNYVFK